MDFPQILFDNPFRVLDLYAEASLEQITLQGRRIKAAIGATGSYVSEKGFDSLPMGFPSEDEVQVSSETQNKVKQAVQGQSNQGQASPNKSLNFYLRTNYEVDKAVALLQNPETRILCRLFWFTGSSALDRRGVKMLAASGLNNALDVWKKIYDSAIKKPTPQQISFLKGAYQNASVALMMFGRVSEAVALVETAPFKWIDFEEISEKSEVKDGKQVSFTREELLQKWYTTILRSGDIADKLGNLGNYGVALQKAAQDVYPIALQGLNKVLIDYAKVPNTMAYAVEAIQKGMPLITDLRYLRVMPQKNFFAPYLTSNVIDTFIEQIDTKVFDYVIKGPTEIKETDAQTMLKFKDSLLQCALALDIFADFVPSDKDKENLEKGKEKGKEKVKEKGNDGASSSIDSHAESIDIFKLSSRVKLKGAKTEELATPYQGLEHLRSIVNPYIEILYDLYSTNLSKLVKQPQRVLTTTTQKKPTLEYGAPLLLAQYASVWYEYKFYCDCYPQGRSYQSCLDKFTEEFYKEVSRYETVAPWQSYLLLFPQTDHATEILDKVNAVRAHVAEQEVDNLQRQKAQSFNSVKVLIAYYSQNPEACTNEEIWSQRALELAKKKSDFRQISHVFGKNQYGREGSEQYRSILKREQFKVSQAIVLVVFAAFLGLIVFKVAELAMLILGFGINFNAEIIGVSIAIVVFILVRIYQIRRKRDSAKNATLGFLASFVIGLFSCVALWSLVPGQIQTEDESDRIQNTIHDYFNSPDKEDGDYPEDNKDRV